jgi:Icc-related predicted phosphoesterase
MIRVAAFGDIHVGADSSGLVRPALETLPEKADVLLIAGDLTKRGIPDEARVLASELQGISIPIVAVLGNHDYEDGHSKEVVEVLTEAGVVMLEGDAIALDIDGTTVAIAGVKGFGGGFAGACASDFGEPEMKAFVGHSKQVATDLEKALISVEGDIKIALTHYSPVEDTLRGERLEIFPFLGSYFLAEAVDRGGAHLALHGHAHGGTEMGLTPGGVHVRNVAVPVINAAYRVYCLSAGDLTPDDCSS